MSGRKKAIAVGPMMMFCPIFGSMNRMMKVLMLATVGKPADADHQSRLA